MMETRPQASSGTTGKPVEVQVPASAPTPPAPLAGPGSMTRSKPETPLADILDGDARREVPIHEHGFVALLDVMPRLVPAGQTADAAIVQAARVSYGQGTKKINEDRGLIRYLLRHRHTTPFEMVEFKFHIAMPIFIARQWIRHRTANVNEYSGRYSVMPDKFYRPTLDQVRKQSAMNRQGGAERFGVASTNQEHGGTDVSPVSSSSPPRLPNADCPMPSSESLTAQAFIDYLRESEDLYKKYLDLTNKGVSREMARIGLPVSLYTQWYWKIDLHNLLHFLSLRMDPHAQEEIQWYARAMHDLVQPLVPITMEAWRDYATEGGAVGGVKLTRLEVEAMRAEIAALKGGRGEAGHDQAAAPASTLATDNKREQAEWEAKRKRLGF